MRNVENQENINSPKNDWYKNRYSFLKKIWSNDNQNQKVSFNGKLEDFNVEEDYRGDLPEVIDSKKLPADVLNMAIPDADEQGDMEDQPDDLDLKDTMIDFKANLQYDISELQGDQNQNSKEISINYKVHVFYYPWYGNPKFNGEYIHWNHPMIPHWKEKEALKWPQGQHEPPGDIGSNFYPELGPYSSNDPETITKHMEQIASAGAGETDPDMGGGGDSRG